MSTIFTPRIGSLFSGYGGLEMGVQEVLGGEVAWHVEFDAAPSKILAHHWPDVPNHGDVRTVDWAAVEPVDILVGGFPCQDVSLAGRRAGLTDGTRSGLWSEYARAIDILRPRLVIIENVRGLLSAEAAGAVEPDPWGVGDGATRPTLNALGVVLGDLAGLGYDTRRVGLRAADAGAPHGRYRVFIVAYPDGGRSSRWAPRPEQTGGNDASLRPGARGARPGKSSADASRDGRRKGWAESARLEGRPDHELGGSDATADSDDGDRHGRERQAGWNESRGATPPGSGRCNRCGEPISPSRTDVFNGEWCACPPADSERIERERRGDHGDLDGSPQEGAGEGDQRERDGDAPIDSGATNWGAYEPAIRRWEVATYRTAPSPTEGTARNGAQRLSPAFVEWMMGLPAGHVTDPAIGITRNEQLKALGNGVVPQQAALALRWLLQPVVGLGVAA